MPAETIEVVNDGVRLRIVDWGRIPLRRNPANPARKFAGVVGFVLVGLMKYRPIPKDCADRRLVPPLVINVFLPRDRFIEKLSRRRTIAHHINAGIQPPLRGCIGNWKAFADKIKIRIIDNNFANVLVKTTDHRISINPENVIKPFIKTFAREIEFSL